MKFVNSLNNSLVSFLLLWTPKLTNSNLNMFSLILISIWSSIYKGALFLGVLLANGCSNCWRAYQVPLAEPFEPSPSRINHWSFSNMICVYFLDTVFKFTIISQSYDLPILNCFFSPNLATNVTHDFKWGVSNWILINGRLQFSRLYCFFPFFLSYLYSFRHSRIVLIYYC